jgi:hypothetical protein
MSSVFLHNKIALNTDGSPYRSFELDQWLKKKKSSVWFKSAFTGELELQ